MKLLLYFARAYPKQTSFMFGCLLLSAIAEGIGLSSLLPVLGLAARPYPDASVPGEGGSRGSQLESVISQVFSTLGLQPSIGLLLLVIVCGMFSKAVLMLLAQKQVGYTVAQVATDLRLTLLRSLLAARWEYYVRQPVGALANSFATEVSRAAMAYQYASSIVALAIQAFLYLSLAAVVSFSVMLGATGTGVIMGLGLKRFVRKSRQAGARQTAVLKALLGQLTDVLFSVKPIKAMARESLVGPLLEEETHRLNRALRREVLSKETLKALQEPLVIGALAGGLYVAMTRWGLPLDALILLAILFARTLVCINKVQKEYQAMVACEAAFWSLQETIARSTEQGEVSLGTARPVLTREISLRNVSFSYGDRPVLCDVSLRASVGQLTAIIGPSGAGKTSILDLMIGLVRPQKGEIWLDDTPLSQVDVKAWRAIVGYVAQETFLLHENVFLNVTLGDPDLTPTDVEKALRASGAWDFVSAMPEGMYTPVGERGSGISGGQRQRIAIARALVRRPQLLILDEATASLDPNSEAAIRETVKALKGEMTIFAIAHHPALLEIADKVYRLEDGYVQQIDVFPLSLQRAG
ncbi:MAG: ABC transporter ATP-binding protein [Candidatus Binatia bacterium]